jgi:DNA-binding NarL/FixJ family response regulator
MTGPGQCTARVTVVLLEDAAAGSRTAEALACDGVELLACTAEPRDAVHVVAEARPEVVVVDLDGGRAGQAAVAAIGSITSRVPEAPVLAVSECDGHASVLAAVRAGAAGYLVKTASAVDLVDAIRRTAAGDAVFSPGLAGVVLEEYGRLVGPADGPARLTDRESDVLRLVVEGLTARQIATRLVLSPRTVENHVQHVLRKLHLTNRAALVRYAIENGLA